MDNKTIKGVYENGELHFAEPVNLAGKWQVEITFLEMEDDTLTADPHAPEKLPPLVRIEELRHDVEVNRPHIGPV